MFSEMSSRKGRNKYLTRQTTVNPTERGFQTHGGPSLGGADRSSLGHLKDKNDFVCITNEFTN